MKEKIIPGVIGLLIIAGAYATASMSATTSQKKVVPESVKAVLVADKKEGTFTLKDVAFHNTTADCWTTINGSVYDVTPWISRHPGGVKAINRICGMDGSAAFGGKHGGQPRPSAELKNFLIGEIKK